MHDEAVLKQRLDSLAPDQRVLFAASCAERLFPLYDLFVEGAGSGDRSLVRAALDTAWEAAPGALAPADLGRTSDAVESLVPDDEDPDWSRLSPLAQNAVASVAYALRTWLSADSQEAVWAARQLYEAADWLIQADAPGSVYADEGEAVTLALDAIGRALAGAASMSAVALRAEAMLDGSRLLQLARQSARPL